VVALAIGTVLCAAAPAQAASQAVGLAACSIGERGRMQGEKMIIPGDLMRWTQESASRNGLPWAMLLSLIWQESTYCQKVVSPSGALGLGQLMPGTARGLGVDPLDPRQNIEGAARYLRQMALRYGEWPRALAAYNAGPVAVDRCGCWDPYAETEQHVVRIIDRHNAIARSLSQAKDHQ